MISRPRSIPAHLEIGMRIQWKKELEQVLMPMLEKYDVVLVDEAQELIRW